MTPSKILFCFCFSFILGVFTSSFFSFTNESVALNLFGWFFLFWALIFILVYFLTKNKKIAILGFLIFVFGLGAWRYQLADLKIKTNSLSGYLGKEVIIAGKIVEESDVREKSSQVIISAAKIFFDGTIKPVTGKILVRANKYQEFKYADGVIVNGLLKEPENFEDFNYKEYLLKRGICFEMDFPQIEVFVEEGYSNFWQFGYGQILKFKNKIRENINQYFSPPADFFLSAILLGDQTRMTPELKEKLNITGLRHLTAISGMHIAILISILMSLFLGMGFWRNQAFYLTVIFIVLFALMVGLRPSVLRGGMMGIIFLLAQKTGRVSTSLRIMAITAAMLLIANPLLLRWDIGFQLSFLALLGIIFLTPLFENFFKFIPEEKFLNFRKILATTFSAQVFTFPILIYNFGKISLVSPLTNVLILPIIYWLILFGFLFGFGSVIGSGLGWLFFFPCWFFISYSIKVIDIFSQPWAAKMVSNIHWFWLVFLYLLLGVFIIWLKKKSPIPDL